jgi:hypothetical protein
MSSPKGAKASRVSGWTCRVKALCSDMGVSCGKGKDGPMLFTQEIFLSV